MDSELKLVVFKLMEDEYGFEIDRVREIRRIRRITRVAQAPAFVEGVIKLRGNVVPVVDLRKRLGLPAKEYGKSTRLIIVNAEGHTLGIAVDSVTDVLTVPPEKIDYPDSILATAVFLKAVAKVPGRMVLVADVEKVLTLEEKELLPVKPAAGHQALKDGSPVEKTGTQRAASASPPEISGSRRPCRMARAAGKKSGQRKNYAKSFRR